MILGMQNRLIGWLAREMRWEEEEEVVIRSDPALLGFMNDDGDERVCNKISGSACYWIVWNS